MRSFLENPHAGLHEFLIRQAHRLRPHAPEQHIELREPEREAVALVNERHVDGVTKRLREHGAEFEPAETGAEDENALFHMVTELTIVDSSRPAAIYQVNRLL